MDTPNDANDAEANALRALPIACTLPLGEMRERLTLIRTLTRDALRSHERGDLDLTLHYRAGAADRVRAMVAVEQRCCAFLTFAVSEDTDGVHVTMRAPEHARDAADELFAQFIPAAGNN